MAIVSVFCLCGIFNTEGIELTKEKLVEMAQAGTLTPAVIASHEKLADAILNSNLVADEGCGLFETLCNEIYASAEAGEKAADNMRNISTHDLNRQWILSSQHIRIFLKMINITCLFDLLCNFFK